MGGVWTDLQGRTSLRGLYAAGEVASTGVHGANRLASNSLLEALVFGARAADAMRTDKAASDSASPEGIAAEPVPVCRDREVLQKIRDITWRHAGIVRNASELKRGLELLDEIADNVPQSNLLTVARLIHECALARPESRGAHFREDFPQPADTAFHSYASNSRITLR
jgi:L-aspartate oxidase